MNNCFITHKVAFKIYRDLRNQQSSLLPSKTNIVPTKISSCSRRNWIDISSAFPDLANEKVDVTVTLKEHVYSSPHFRFHQYSGGYPKGSFCFLDNNVYIACPELMFCQLASSYSFEKLLLLGYEICGSYSYNDNSLIGFSNNLKAVASRQSISEYISKLQKCSYNFPGLKAAKKASEYLLDNSASPQESRLSLLLTGPRSIGAFNIKNCSLNHKINLSNKAAQICNQPYVYPDLCIKNSRIAIEYDSDFFHSESSQNRKDKRRINALQFDG